MYQGNYSVWNFSLILLLVVLFFNLKKIKFMKSLLTASILIIYCISFAQITPNYYTDCDSNTESIYGIVGQGTPLIIASNGFDCSICMSHAPNVKAFAEAHPEIRVWGAMGYKYSGAQPTCTGVNQWESDYAWTAIFMFADVNKDWEGVGYPTYYVISPVDSTIQYEGSSFAQASAKALEFAPTGIVEKTRVKLSVFYDALSHNLQLNYSGDEQIKTVMLTNLTGQVVFELPVYTNERLLRIPLTGNISSGMYLVFLRGENGKMHSGKVIVQ